MTNEQIDLLAESIAAEVPTLIGDLAPHIREAAAAVLEETQEKENAKPMLNISFGVGINLATDPPAYTIKAAVSVKRTVSTDLVLRDPNQPDLPLDGGSDPLRTLAKHVRDGKITITAGKKGDE